MKTKERESEKNHSVNTDEYAFDLWTPEGNAIPIKDDKKETETSAAARRYGILRRFPIPQPKESEKKATKHFLFRNKFLSKWTVGGASFLFPLGVGHLIGGTRDIRGGI